MFSLESTPCFLALASAVGDDKQVIDPPGPGSKVAERLRFIVGSCGYQSEAEFARAMGRLSQHVTNWKRRNSFGDAELDIRRLTGAGADYLADGTGPPFPEGPILAGTKGSPSAVVDEGDATVTQLVRRLEGDVDQLRLVVTMLLQALPTATPELGELVLEKLRNAAPRAYAEKGFQSVALLALETAPRKSARAPRGAPRRGAS